MIKQGIYSLLVGNSAVAALIGDRLYPVIIPPEQSTYPAATYAFLAGGPPEWTLDKRQLNHGTLQLDAYANSYAECDQVLSAFSDVLNGLANTTLTGGARILFAECTNDSDHFEDNGRVYRSIAEYDIQYVEPNH